MKRIVGYLLKCIVAFVIAFVILSLFSLIYYNPPLATEQPDFITNHKFETNTGWTFMLEGAGFGVIDNIGYNNAYYKDCSSPDVVVVGSSHTEALQVPQNANFVHLMNQKFAEDDLPDNDFECLNIGVSGHSFEVSVSNFEHIVNKYKDAKYIIIETYNNKFSPSKLDKMAEGKYHSPLKQRGLVYRTAQKVPYFRLLYKKVQEAATAKSDENEANLISDNNYDINTYTQKLDAVLNKISTLADANGIKTIILLHEGFALDEEGNILEKDTVLYKNIFKDCCEKNGITAVDVLPAMIDNYKKTFEFSYGFSNTVPGKGHLNKTGHRIIAQELYEQINKMEVR